MGYVGQTCLPIETRCNHGRGYRLGTKIRDAFDLYTEDNFVCIILEEGLTKKESDEREQYWISFLGTLWPNGYNLENGGTLYHSIHPETIIKRTQNHPSSIKVSQYSLDGSFIKRFNSIKEASMETKIPYSQIYNCCWKIHHKESAGGSIWKFA